MKEYGIVLAMALHFGKEGLKKSLRKSSANRLSLLKVSIMTVLINGNSLW